MNTHIVEKQRNNAVPPTMELIELADMKAVWPMFFKTGQSDSLSLTPTTPVGLLAYVS